jgi:hypothetical protein
MGRLRLQSDQSLDGVGHRHLPTTQEHLPLKRGAVESAQAEHCTHREVPQ